MYTTGVSGNTNKIFKLDLHQPKEQANFRSGYKRPVTSYENNHRKISEIQQITGQL